jgi:nicotinamidase-related amidase
MPSHDSDLHGNAPDRSPIVLLLIDVINDLEFPGGEELLPFATEMAQNLAAFKERCHDAGVSCIYVNDNFGRWRSDFNVQVSRCSQPGTRGSEIVRQLLPGPDDYFILKPKNSGFFYTALELLLNYLHAERLILTGLTGNNCVLFTAHEAYVRDYQLLIPSDCIASASETDNEYALEQMRTVLKADVRDSSEFDLRELLASSHTEPAPENPHI